MIARPDQYPVGHPKRHKGDSDAAQGPLRKFHNAMIARPDQYPEGHPKRLAAKPEGHKGLGGKAMIAHPDQYPEGHPKSLEGESEA